MNRLLFTVLFFMMPVLGNGATYYVAKTGSNNNSCAQAQSTSTAKLTVAVGLTCLSAGDTLIVKAGTYYERLRVPVSGSPAARITITGERDANGQWLTIIDGSEPLTEWITAPEVGSGVYKTTMPRWTGPVTGQTNGPCSLNANGKAVSMINWYWTDGGLDSDYGKWESLMATVDSDILFTGTEALFATVGATTYIHFRDNSNPNSKTIRVAPWSYRCQPRDIPDFAPFFLNAKNYITIQNFEIQGSSSMVVDYGGTGNIIEGNYIHDGDHKVHLYGSTSSTVRNNKITWNSIGHTTYHPQAWTPYTDTLPSSRVPIVYMYSTNKYITGNYDQYAVGVYAFNTSGAEISGNEAYNLNSGVMIMGASSSNPIISGNYIHGTFGSAIYFQADDVDGLTGTVTIANNLLSDINTSFRANYAERFSSRLSVYIYGNRVYLPPDIGDHHYFTVSATPGSSDTRFFIYHNAFVGGVDGYTNGNAAGTKFPNMLHINNIIQLTRSTGQVYQAYSDPTFCSSANTQASWDYNWTFGEAASCVWVGDHNIRGTGKLLNDAALPSNWSPPMSSEAGYGGIDISRTFTVGGRTYSPLPGFSPGYFSSSAPSIGAVQGGISPPPVQTVQPPAPPTNLRVTGSN